MTSRNTKPVIGGDLTHGPPAGRMTSFRMRASQIFLLSPAHCGGKRAGYLVNPEAQFPLARQIQSGGIPLGEAFSFLSGLYFRGKLAYATRFGRPHQGKAGALVITANRGLLPVDTPVRVEDLTAFGDVDIHQDDPRYREPLERDLASLVPGRSRVVLLGSIATAKYVDVLVQALGSRLLFPAEFVGRGDMSGGALLLRAAREGRELEYVPLLGAVRSTARPRTRAAR